ncbi:MAG: hypothetical protein ABI321_16835 [Polyangia bacterium]
MNRLLLSLVAVASLAACNDNLGGGAYDLGPDLALPTQVTHVGIDTPACCIETTFTAPRVMYIANPTPGGSDFRGRDIATTGQLHIADAYGADFVLADGVPRNSYAFTRDGRFIYYLSKSSVDSTFALNVAPLSIGTLGALNPVTVIPRGLDNTPLARQAFFSPSGRYLIIGVFEPGIQNSPDLTVVEIESAKVVFTLPNGSFDYIENVTSADVMIYENSVASKTPGVPSVEGLYQIPLATLGAGGTPALIDTRTANYTLTSDERRVIYTKQDGTLWMFDLYDQSRLQLASGIVTFTLGPAADGPLVYVSTDYSVHVRYLIKPELLATAAGTADPWSSFTFGPDQSTLYYFDRTSTQDSVGDLYRLDLRPGHTTGTPTFIDRRVSLSDITFNNGRMRYIRNVNGRGDYGELVSSDLDGSGALTIAEGVATSSIAASNPVSPTDPTHGTSRGPVDMSQPITPPVYAEIVNTIRNDSVTSPLFDDSQPVTGSLGFSRSDGAPLIIDPSVHVGSYRFSTDGYVLVYAGDTKLDTKLKAYLGTIHLFQTLIDRNPVVPVLDGVSEIGVILDRGFFAAAPGATPSGIYFIRY